MCIHFSAIINDDHFRLFICTKWLERRKKKKRRNIFKLIDWIFHFSVIQIWQFIKMFICNTQKLCLLALFWIRAAVALFLERFSIIVDGFVCLFFFFFYITNKFIWTTIYLFGFFVCWRLNEIMVEFITGVWHAKAINWRICDLLSA